MPAERLSVSPCRVAQYDVGGFDSPVVPRFVCHVGLITAANDAIPSAGPLLLTHMAPPLRRDEPKEGVAVIGSVPLRPDEIVAVRIFLDETRLEYEAQRIRRLDQYVIHPHVRPVREANGTLLYRRFSCAGLVLEAYREAEIDLLVTDPLRLPPVTVPTLATAYPAFASRLQDSKVRQEYGLEGHEPWPVVLPGYLLHALERSEAVIRREPYLPHAGDECFPV